MSFRSPIHSMAACALLALASHGAALADEAPNRFWSDAWRGWHFYEDPEAEAPAPVPAPAPAKPLAKAPSPKLPRAPELVVFERLQKTLE